MQYLIFGTIATVLVVCSAQPDSFAIKPIPVEKDGVCPPPPPFGTCDERCSGDASCPGVEKCCSHGCGHSCQTPIDLCELPKVTGPCLALFNRWWYNKNTNQCERFIYGGCQGNKNNFQTKRACERRCKPHSGTCPFVNFALRPVIFCLKPVSTCIGDHQCRNNEKCCEQLCGGFKCEKALKGPKTKPGTCPAVRTTPSIHNCNCNEDIHCPGQQKCCGAPGALQCKICSDPVYVK